MTDTKEYTENLQKLLAESRQPSVSRKDLDLAFGEEFVESVAARLESTNALQFDETLDQDALNKCANHRLFNFLQRNQRDPHPSLEKGHFFELRKWTTAAAAERDDELWRLLGTMATQTAERGENRLDNPTTMTARRMMLRLIEVVMGEFEWSQRRSSARRERLRASRSDRRGSPRRLARSNPRSVRLVPRERRRRRAVRGGLIDHEPGPELALHARSRPCFTHFSIATPREFHSSPERAAAPPRERFRHRRGARRGLATSRGMHATTTRALVSRFTVRSREVRARARRTERKRVECRRRDDVGSSRALARAVSATRDGPRRPPPKTTATMMTDDAMRPTDEQAIERGIRAQDARRAHLGRPSPTAARATTKSDAEASVDVDAVNGVSQRRLGELRNRAVEAMRFAPSWLKQIQMPPGTSPGSVIPVVGSFEELYRIAQIASLNGQPLEEIEEFFRGKEDVRVLELSSCEQRAIVTTDHRNRTHTVSLRGTKNIKNVAQNLRLGTAPTGRAEDVPVPMHRGYRNIAQRCLEAIEPLLLDGYELQLTGHSLGGAAAVALALLLHQKKKTKIRRVVTFGSPKLGPKETAQAIEEIDILRVVQKDDIIPLLPMSRPLVRRPYCHVGEGLVLDNDRPGVFADLPARVGRSWNSMAPACVDRKRDEHHDDVDGGESGYETSLERRQRRGQGAFQAYHGCEAGADDFPCGV